MTSAKGTTLTLDEQTSDKLAFLAENQHRSMAGQVRHMIDKEMQALGLVYKKEAVA